MLKKKLNEIIFQIVVLDDIIEIEGATKMSELMITNTTLTELDLSSKWNEMNVLKWGNTEMKYEMN